MMMHALSLCSSLLLSLQTNKCQSACKVPVMPKRVRVAGDACVLSLCSSVLLSLQTIKGRSACKVLFRLLREMALELFARSQHKFLTAMVCTWGEEYKIKTKLGRKEEQL